MLAFDLTKQFGKGNTAFTLDVKAQLPMGKIIGIFGPSGAGKSSLLRLLSGLEKLDQGFIKVKNEVWSDTTKRIFLPPQKRAVGYLFQDYSLFPNMTVAENLAFAAEKNIDPVQLEELLAATQLMDKKNHYPSRLSGGEQQRAALARALVRRPSLLLLDEPLAALDQTIRTSLQTYILTLHERFRPTTLFVSHNRHELATLCDLVIEIEAGKIIQIGTPDLLFGETQTIDLVSGCFRVLTLTRSENKLIVELVASQQKIKLALNSAVWPELKSGDRIQLTEAEFILLSSKIKH